MKQPDPKLVVLALGFACAAAAAHGQVLKLVGLQGEETELTSSQFAALPHVDLTLALDGKTTTFKGVPLAALLARVDAPSGKALRGRELRDVVLVTAKDGYAVVLSLAEADPAERKERVVLADEADGHPLDERQGPYRLLVEGDQRGARYVRMVTTIQWLQIGADK